MGVAIGGRHTLVGATTIPTPRRTVALTGAMVIILTRRLTMTTTRELTAGKPQRTVRTARRLPELLTIHTPGRTLEEHQSRHLTAAELPRRHTIRTRAPMRRPDKVPVRMLNGAAPTCHEEIKALPWAITRRLMEPSQAPRLLREEKWPLPARSRETVRWVKLQAAICTPGMTGTSTRTRGTAGRSTTTEAGIP